MPRYFMVECTCTKVTVDGVVTYLKDNDCVICGRVVQGETRRAPPAVQDMPLPEKKKEDE